MVTDRARTILTRRAGTTASRIGAFGSLRARRPAGAITFRASFGRARTVPLVASAAIAVYAVAILLAFVSHVARPSSLWIDLVRPPYATAQMRPVGNLACGYSYHGPPGSPAA